MDEPKTSRPSGVFAGAAGPGGTRAGTQGPEIAAGNRGNALPAGFPLGNFEIESVVGVGGFGIVYRARDLALEREVAIKEYMPGVLAERTADFRITVRSAEDRDTFVTGLRSFVNEARMLARFAHPSLVSVLSYWEDHGTAYMVMPYYQGDTLKRLLNQRPPPEEGWIRRVFLPVLDVLEMLHGEQCLHRDVAPDNILMLAGERPLLLDLGAARRVVGEATQALTAILKPAYAPMEQYSSDGRMRQGPWTDVYACAGVLHWMVTGQPPPTAMQRMENDVLPLLDAVPAGRYSPAFLAGIRAGLGLRPEQRPQTIASLRGLLFGTPPPVAAPADQERTVIVAPASAAAEDPDRTVVVPVPRVSASAAPSASPAATPTRSSRSLALLAGVLLLVAAGGGLAWWRLHATPAQPAVVAAPAPAVAPSAMPASLPARPQSPATDTPQAPPAVPQPPANDMRQLPSADKSLPSAPDAAQASTTDKSVAPSVDAPPVPVHPRRPPVKVAGEVPVRPPKAAESGTVVRSAECLEATRSVAAGNDGPDDVARLKAVCGAARPH